MTFVPQGHTRTRGRRSLVALIGALPVAMAWAGGCANVSGLTGLSLDPQCSASCASDGSAAPLDAGPKTGRDAADDVAAAIDTGTGATIDAADSAATNDSAEASDTGIPGADGGVSPGEIRCASGDPCTAGPEECCMNNASPPSLSCASSSSAQRCPNGTEIKCDDPSDCSGGACCLQLNSSGYLLQTACESACSGTGWYELCAAGGTCSAGTCSALAVLPAPPFTPPWFYACQ